MKRLYMVIALMFVMMRIANAQILCVQCYQQNDTVYPGGTNLIQNGGFEDTTNLNNSNYGYFCPNSTYYSCNITNWICTGGGTETYAHICDSGFSFIPQGIKDIYFGNDYTNACSSLPNDTSCLNNLLCTVSGIPLGYPYNPNNYFGGDTGVCLSQIVNGLVIGSSYILEFWAGGEYGPGNNEGLFALDVGFGNIFLRDKSIAPHTGIGTRYIIVFNATSSSHIIKFTNWGHICNHCTELILDDVRLYQWNSASAPCGETEGINEIKVEETNITISPNPFTSQTTITFSEEQKNTTIYIRDVLGREVNSQQVSGNSAVLDMSGTSKGIYFVQITDEKGNTINKKIVVQ